MDPPNLLELVMIEMYIFSRYSSPPLNIANGIFKFILLINLDFLTNIPLNTFLGFL